MTRHINENGTLNPYVLRADEVKNNDQMGYKVIMVIQKHSQSFCAYRGLTDWSDKRVVEEGDKVSDGVCQALFPAVVEGLMSEGWYYND